MKNKLLLKNKGFTLVECIVAVAVFAVVTIMILMIMASTVQTQKTAMEAEEDLNNIVQNIVKDDTNKKFDASTTKTLQMMVGTSTSPNFSMTFSTIDGYKNFVKCPSCGEIHNNVDYMTKAYDTPEYEADVLAGNADFKACHWFNTSSMQYVCPNCLYSFTDSLECLDCGNGAGVTGNVSSFILDGVTGNYYCPACGSGEVRQQGITEAVTTDSTFNLAGMSANAIRYSNIKQPENTEAQDFIKLTGAAHENFNIELTYKPHSKISTTGKYKLTVTGLNLEAGETGSITITLPPCYLFDLKSCSSNLDGLDEHGMVYCVPGADYKKNASKLTFTNLTFAGVGSTFWLEFTLNNYETGNSFDNDYQAMQKPQNFDKNMPNFTADPGKAGKDLPALVNFWFKRNNKQFDPTQTII